MNKNPYVTVRVPRELDERLEAQLGPEFHGRMKVTLRTEHTLRAWLKREEQMKVARGTAGGDRQDEIT